MLSSIVRYETNSGTTELVFFFFFTINICPYTQKPPNTDKSTGGGMDKWMCMRLLRPVLMGSAFVRLFVCLCIEWHTSTEKVRFSAGLSIIKRTDNLRENLFFFVSLFLRENNSCKKIFLAKRLDLCARIGQWTIIFYCPLTCQKSGTGRTGHGKHRPLHPETWAVWG